MYVYYLLDPRDSGEPCVGEHCYVGITVRQPLVRLRVHLYHFGQTHKTHWLQKLEREGVKPVISVRCVIDDWSEAGRVEKHLIRSLRDRGVVIVNTAAGGDGGNTGPVKPEVRQKMSAAQLGDRNNSKRPDVREKLRQSALNVPADVLCKRNDAIKRSWVKRKAEGKVSPRDRTGKFAQLGQVHPLTPHGAGGRFVKREKSCE